MAHHCQIPQYACSFDLSKSQLTARDATLAGQQYRPTQVVAYADGGGASRYAAIWMRDLRSSLTQIAMDQPAADYQDDFDDRNREGYRLLCVSAAATGESLRYAGLWEDGGWKGFHARHGLSATEYQEQFDIMAADGYRLIWVNGSATPSTSSYSAIWSRFADADRHARHNLPIEQYQDVFNEMKADGYRIAHFSAHRVQSQTRFAAIWVKGRGDYDPHARHDLTKSELENELDRLAWEDWKPICITGYAVSDGGTRYAGIWVKNARTCTIQGRAGSGLEVVEDSIQSIMAASRVTAASVAISHKGKLVLAKGLANSTDGEGPISATSIFRVASVSKTLTGAAVVRAIQDGKLAFDDRLLDVLGWKDAVKDKRLADVTVDHLLHHRGGWSVDGDDESHGDPMFNDVTIAEALNIALPITRQSIFRWTTTERDLDDPPGKTYGYSNYGYMLLGMILERVTGERYEDYVARTLLAPLGIRRMRCAQTLFTGRFPDEVTYHHPHTKLYCDVMAADAPKDAMQMYGSLNFVNMAPHGSWVASAVDLVRFASAFDDPGACPILSASSVKTLLTRTQPAESSSDYACGWRVQHGTGETHHGGNFNGTGALLYRHPDGTDIAIIFNRSTNETFRAPHPDPDMEVPTVPGWDLMELARSWVADIRSWPSIDMWDDFF